MMSGSRPAMLMPIRYTFVCVSLSFAEFRGPTTENEDCDYHPCTEPEYVVQCERESSEIRSGSRTPGLFPSR